MNQMSSQLKDDRRANRRSSVWLGLLVLGAILVGAICYQPQQSRPRATKTETKLPSAVAPATVLGALAPSPGTDSLPESLADLARESDPGRQEELLVNLVYDRSLVEIPAALQQLAASTNRLALDLAARWLRRWAEADPLAAAAFAVTLPDGIFRRTLLDQAVLAWMENDWNAATEWARGSAAGPDRDRLLQLVAEETIRIEPVESLRLATQINPSVERDDLIRHAAMEWAGQDVRAAQQWARQIDDPALRSQVLAAVAVAWADQDAPAAATLAVRDLPPGRTQDDAVVSILNRWVQFDADAAAAWVNQFPAGQLKQAARDSVLAIWSVNDPARARAWSVQEAAGNRF